MTQTRKRAGTWRRGESLAEIRDLVHPVLMASRVDLPLELLESLHAAAADGANIHAAHNLLCSALGRGDPDWCDCGVPGLLRGLAELLPLPPGAVQPYRPEWTPAAA